MFDDSFEDRSGYGSFAGGSKAVFADSFEDRRDFGGPARGSLPFAAGAAAGNAGTCKP